MGRKSPQKHAGTLPNYATPQVPSKGQPQSDYTTVPPTAAIYPALKEYMEDPRFAPQYTQFNGNRNTGLAYAPVGAGSNATLSNEAALQRAPTLSKYFHYQKNLTNKPVIQPLLTRIQMCPQCLMLSLTLLKMHTE